MLSDLNDILEIIKFFHCDNPIMRSKALITKDYNQQIIGVNMSKHICENCKQEFEWPPGSADTWTCPTCGHKNQIGNATLEDDSLDGLCQYEGPGHDLPLGGHSKIPNWFPETGIIKAWAISDPESDAGFSMKKRAELTKEDTIIGAQVNRNTLAKLIAEYGEDFYLLREANGGPFMTLAQWSLKFPNASDPNNDVRGIALVALRNMRIDLNGPGVKF
ncbi:hypothetical protein M0R72_14990 [Candidatus Pacearchaeota archaeon]|jgi:hypothetical protein|nr:hypothetical protein [Candidatus Pacearchaeota archaeon]